MSRFRVGPGFLVTAAFIGPGTIVTASRAGAGYGAALLWAVLFSVIATVVLQNMGGAGGPRRAAGPRRGHPRQPAEPALARAAALGLIAVTILIGNAAFQTGNLLGASIGLDLLTGLPKGLLVGIIGGLAGALLMTGTYKTIQNALVALVGLMSVVFLLVAILTAPDLGDLVSGLLVPRIPSGALLTVLALIGTTVVSYNLFLHASATLERWPNAERNDDNLVESRRDTLFSVALGGLITASVVVAASPLLGQGAEAANAATVAARLEPLLGRAAPLFFGIGLFAAGLTSAITAPLAAAYAAGGAMGWGSDLKSGRFRLLWAFVLLTGMFCGIFLGASPYQIILLAQAGNGIVLPLTLVLLLIVANRRAIMGKYPQLAARQCARRAGGAGDLVALPHPVGPHPRPRRVAPGRPGPPVAVGPRAAGVAGQPGTAPVRPDRRPLAPSLPAVPGEFASTQFEDTGSEFRTNSGRKRKSRPQPLISACRRDEYGGERGIHPAREVDAMEFGTGRTIRRIAGLTATALIGAVGSGASSALGPAPERPDRIS